MTLLSWKSLIIGVISLNFVCLILLYRMSKKQEREKTFETTGFLENEFKTNGPSLEILLGTQDNVGSDFSGDDSEDPDAPSDRMNLFLRLSPEKNQESQQVNNY